MRGVCRINWKRIAAGGLAAGLIINLSEFIMSGVLLREDWERALLALNLPVVSSLGGIMALQGWGLLMGLSAVFFYAHLIDRYPNRWRTACIAGAWVWVLSYLSGSSTGVAMGLIPVSLAVDTSLGGLIAMVGATLAGAALYRPGSAVQEPGGGRRTDSQ
jgi:hypothetical protein